MDLWDLTFEQATGKDFFELSYPTELAERLQGQIREVFRAAVTVKDETRYVSPLGVDGFYEYIFSPVFASDGSVALVAGTTRDITQRKKLEMAALAAKKAKDDFIAALSHELRTPLTPALMTTIALQEDVRLPEEVKAQLRTIERNIALEARLIDDLLDLTTIIKGKLSLHVQPSDIHSLIGLAIDIVAPEAVSRNITITRNFEAKRAGLIVDPARIQQVVWNLLRNAVKFTPSNGNVSVRTEDLRVDGSDWLKVEVTDSGIGIGPQALTQIFNPFEQGGMANTHRFGGLGLGLSIARAVVELHRGTICAKSEGLGSGASFVVELPGATLPPNGSQEYDRPHSSRSGKKPAPLNLLLVEDHESTLMALTTMLRRDGHSVVARSTVAAALTAAGSAKFDVVISDLGLPDGSGNELMSELSAKYGLRGIALSGYGMDEDIGRSKAAGFVLHLVKPVPNLQLRSALATLAGS